MKKQVVQIEVGGEMPGKVRGDREGVKTNGTRKCKR